MRKFKRLTMTLALLIMAVGGAWAQSSPNVVELEAPAEWATDENYMTAGDLPGFKAISNVEEAKAWTGAPADDIAILFYAFNGDDAYYVLFENGKPNLEDKTKFKKSIVFSNSNSGLKTYYTGELTEWLLTPDETGKTWTLAEMPASNIELQVEYFAESNLFLSKDALADKASIAVTAGDLGVQFGEDGKSANTVTEGSAMTVTYNGTKKVLGMKVAKKADNAYLKWDNTKKELVAAEIPAEVTTVANADADVTWTAGTYVVEGDVTINGKITLSGDVNLIIKDGAKLTAKRIFSADCNKLYIYGQAQKSGQLVVDYPSADAIYNLSTLEVHSAELTATSSKDGRGGFGVIGTINVYGGLVDATGENGYGIYLNEGGSMNIYGGEVKAEGKGNDDPFNYGILCDDYDPESVTTVTVYGGKLWAGNANNKALNNINLQKGAGFTGKIETSNDGSSWAEYTDDATPDAKYVRAGY